jgi:hypothetical protein
MRKQIKADPLVILLAFTTFFLSYILLSYYTEGDQIPYNSLYAALSDANIEDAVALSIAYTSGGEPLTALIMWIGANLGIEKKVYSSLLNIVLATSLFLFARRNQMGRGMRVLLFTNFYYFVLLTSAERLKLAYIIILVATLLEGRVRSVLFLISPLAHYQNIILISSIALSGFEASIKNLILNFRINKKLIMAGIGLASAAVIIGYFTFEGILIKYDAYSEPFSIYELVNIAILASLAIYVSRNRFRMFIALMPMVPVILQIGGTRVNMIAVTIAIYFLTIERRMHHPLIVLLMIYFSLKTIGFIDRIFTEGHGF